MGFILTVAPYALIVALLGLFILMRFWKPNGIDFGTYFAGSAKKVPLNLLLSIVALSVAAGIMLGLAIMQLEKEYASGELRLVAVGASLAMAAILLHQAIQSCRKILKLIP
jgi:hypothetical protein